MTPITQSNVSNINWGQQVEINRMQVVKRLKQIYACLARLTAPDDKDFQTIPSEAGIEIQHALSHLALETDTESREQKAKRWHQALSHLNRALIDFLKIYTLDIFPSYSKSVDFMEQWLKTRQNEYKEHASSTQSPSASSTIDELLTVRNYEKLLNLSLNTDLLDFTEDDLKGDLWHRYSVELDNWMNSELMLGCLKGVKDVGNLEQLLDTLWKLNSDLLAEYNLNIQMETLEEVSTLGINNKWHGNLWKEIADTLSNTDIKNKENILPLYKRFLDYFRVTPWRALNI